MKRSCRDKTLFQLGRGHPRPPARQQHRRALRRRHRPGLTNGLLHPLRILTAQLHMHLADRRTLATWASGGRPLWELLPKIPPPRQGRSPAAQAGSWYGAAVSPSLCAARPRSPRRFPVLDGVLRLVAERGNSLARL